MTSAPSTRLKGDQSVKKPPHPVKRYLFKLIRQKRLSLKAFLKLFLTTVLLPNIK